MLEKVNVIEEVLATVSKFSFQTKLADVFNY